MGSLAESHSQSEEVELIFLGTGTSSSLPHIECITAPPEETPCHTCQSTLTSGGRKNIRRNTSVALRMTSKDGQKVTIIIDVGKNFQASALQWFPKYGLRRIDAVLITHAHADAMNGLDDLRGWTLNAHIQSHIDVYLSAATFTEVQRAFPFLVFKEFASGGGDVPDFKWHIIQDSVQFEIGDTGIQVTPFAVHHGRVFATTPLSGSFPTPNATTPMVSGSSTPQWECLSADLTTKAQKIHPYVCLGFKISNAVVYVADVSHIPDAAWSLLEHRSEDWTGPFPVFVCDCLRLQAHTSHFGLGEAIAASRRLGAIRTYLTGFGHEVSHDEYVMLGEVAGGHFVSDEAKMTEVERRGIKVIGEGTPLWVRPAHDGLRVFLSCGGGVRDESYD